MRITLTSLRKLGACADHVEEFRAAFPRGLTVKGGAPPAGVAERIIAAGLDVDWFATHALPAPAEAEYQRVCVPAYAEYQRVCVCALWRLLAALPAGSTP